MTAKTAQRDVFGDTMIELCSDDARTVLLDGDLANSTKSDKLAVARPERFFMMGIAEQNLVGVAAGMASVGLKPWISSFAAFIATRDLDQIRVVVAQPRLNVKFAAHYSGILTGYTGKTHQVVNDIAIMRSLPNMIVVVPCDGVEARAAMRVLNDYDGPVYLRLTRDPMPDVMPAEYEFRIGQVITLRSGADLCIIATGSQTARAVEAAEMLASEKISATVLHVPTIKPLDQGAIVSAARGSRGVVVCEEHSVMGGLGGAVAEALSQAHPMRIERMGLLDIDGESAPNDALIEKYGLSSAHIAARARDFFASL